MSHHVWLLDRAMALLDALMAEREERLVNLPEEGASLEEVERAAILEALRRSHWVQKRAAALLRSTPRIIGYKIRQHGIVPPGGEISRRWKS